MLGPLELCRRDKVLVWDDRKEVLANSTTRDLITITASPLRPSWTGDAPVTPPMFLTDPDESTPLLSTPRPPRRLSRAHSEQPPSPTERRPIPVSKVFDMYRQSRIDGQSGFSMLEQLEALGGSGYQDQAKPPPPRRSASSFADTPTRQIRVRSGSVGEGDIPKVRHGRWSSLGLGSRSRIVEAEPATTIVVVEVRSQHSCDFSLANRRPL